MQNRREFLKRVALFGATAAATLPATNLLAQNISLPRPVDRDGLFTISYGEIRPRRTPRQITIPNVGEYQVLKGDFHIHTLFSDGTVMPRDRVLEAVHIGLDVISITDHIEHRPFIGRGELRLAENNDDHNRPYNLARPVAEQNNLILVRGTEITKGPWHFNAVFLEDVNPVAAVVQDWRRMLEVSVDQGAFVFWNHPSWINGAFDANNPVGLQRGDPMRFHDEIEEVREKGHIHGIEVFNGTSFYPIAMDWCVDRNLAPITVSDIHQSEWESHGMLNPLRPMQLILAKDRTHDAVKEAHFEQRVIGWAENMILGKEPWVGQLFDACVTIERRLGASRFARFVNRSDIPCIIEIEGTTLELLPRGAVERVFQNKLRSFTVQNWFVGMNKPLVVEV